MSRYLRAGVAAVVAFATFSSAIAGAAAPIKNGKLAYTTVVSAWQLFSQTADGASARRLVASRSVDFEPVLSPDGTHLAFVSGRSGNDEIYVASADGSNPRKLTSHPAYDSDPEWSPDSNRVAFTSNRAGSADLYVVSADGGAPTRLTTSGDDEYDPSWSPDGARIAFSFETEDEDPEIHVMSADGSGGIPLTANVDYDAEPAWSPDGTRLAFVSDRGPQSDSEVWVMRADGTNPAAVTATSGSIDDWGPAWARDGSRIAFVSDRTDDEDVFLIGPDGKGLVNLSNEEDVDDFDPSWTADGRVLFASERAASLGVEAAAANGSARVFLSGRVEAAGNPDWSLDGTRVAFAGSTNDGDRIFVASAGRRGVRQLTRDPRFDDSFPAWSPTGESIAFVREDEFGAAFLFTMNADGTGLRFLLEAGDLCCPEWSPGGGLIALSLDSQIVIVDRNGKGQRLVSGNSENTSPTWSPDGRLIAFDSDRDDDWDIYVVRATGGPATQLTRNTENDEWPDWSPDGRLIAFSRGDLDELESSVYVMRTDGTKERRVPLQAPAATPDWQRVTP